MLERLYAAGAYDKWSWPEPLTNGLFDAIPRRELEAHPFLRLYIHVTREIRSQAEHQHWGQEEALFFEYLIAGFFIEYRNWPSAAHEYLDIFKDASRALEVIAHAYLHIAFDLPRVLLRAWRDVPGDRALFRRRFLDLQDGLKRVLDRDGTNTRVMGPMAFMLRLMPGRSHFLDVFGNWMLVLRSNAFLHAESLHEEPRAQQAMVDALYRRMCHAARDVMDHHPRNPIRWLVDLRTWHAWTLLPPLIVAQGRSLEPIPTPVRTAPWPWGTIALVAAAGAGGTAASLWLIDAWLASYAEALGRALQSAFISAGRENDSPTGGIEAFA